MTFWHYFIKDYHTIDEEKAQKAKLIVGCMGVLLILELFSLFLSFFGIVIATANSISILIAGGLLLLHRVTGDETLVFMLTLVLAIIVLFYEILHTGGISSFNIKWFFVFLILVSFMKPKLMIPYAILIICLYFGIYYYSTMAETNAERIELAKIMLIDHLFFMFSFGSLLVILHSFRSSARTNLINSKRQLEKRTVQLNKRNIELQRFSHIVSHDLKTHLRTITSFSTLLEQRLKGNMDEKVQEYIQFVTRGSQRLHGLLQDIQDFNNLSENPIGKTDQNLNEIIFDIKESMAEYLESKNAIISISKTLPTVEGSRFYLHMLFKNLIINGIKFNESDVPKISIDYQIEDLIHKVSIQDNGIGISEEFHDHVFGMFSKLHVEDRYAGSGLGLALCKKIMSRMKGKIYIVNKPEKGTKIQLEFLRKREYRIVGSKAS